MTAGDEGVMTGVAAHHEPERRIATDGAVLVRQPGPAELSPRRHARRHQTLKLVLGIGTPVALVALWQLASSQEWIDPKIYSSPSDTVSKARELWKEGRLQDDLWASGKRVVLGYVYGAGLGLLAGFVTGMFRWVRAALEPMLNALYSVPKLALISPFLLIFGFGDAPAIALIAVTVFFFVWIPTLSVIVSLPHGYREAASSLGVGRWRMLVDVLLPASLPQIVVGLRISAGVSVLMVIGIEFVIGSDGIGYLIEQGRQLNIIGWSYVGIVVAALMGVVFMAIIRLIGRLLTPWDRQQRDGATYI